MTNPKNTWEENELQKKTHDARARNEERTAVERALDLGKSTHAAREAVREKNSTPGQKL